MAVLFAAIAAVFLASAVDCLVDRFYGHVFFAVAIAAGCGAIAIWGAP